MTSNRFAQLKKNFETEPPKERTPVQRVGANRKAPDSYDRKGRFVFSLHHDVRHSKLEELVAYNKAKSASDYLEKLIIQEWEKLPKEL
ncbi:hypothetical protein [Streptococcus suis]|uniref:Uncharacterized protein n=1 Tax=Streptococcus suis TaxID=1307 RepID=A0A2I5KM98_STRSU|nr:hypothetical protein [Streptococcus suis]AUA18460.1 hypothetical protein CWI26_02590 [Streptococcus suis]